MLLLEAGVECQPRHFNSAWRGLSGGRLSTEDPEKRIDARWGRGSRREAGSY